MTPPSTPPSHFDALYAANADPWQLGTSAYEAEKYRITIDQLGTKRFQRGLELGCSIGTLTARMAASCDALLGVDCAPAALHQARRRCSALAQVRFAQLTLPQAWPDGTFDLMVFSEILYFWDAEDIARAAAHTVASLEPGGLVLTVNWRGPNDGAMPGDSAAEHFMRALPSTWPVSCQLTFDSYRIDGARRPATPA